MNRILFLVCVILVSALSAQARTIATRPIFLPVTLNAHNNIIVDHIQYRTNLELEGRSFLATFQLQVMFRQYVEDRGFTFEDFQKSVSKGQLKFTRFSFDLNEQKYILDHPKTRSLSEVCETSQTQDEIYLMSMLITGPVRYEEVSCEISDEARAKVKTAVDLVLQTPLKFSAFAGFMNALTCVRSLSPVQGELKQFRDTPWVADIALQNPQGGKLCP